MAAVGCRHRPPARARAVGGRRGAPAGLPVLCAQVGGAVSRVDSLPDAPSAGTARSGAAPTSCRRRARAPRLWLEWESGERSALPTPAGLDERAAPLSVAASRPRSPSRAARSSTARCWPSAAPAGPRRPSRRRRASPRRRCGRSRRWSCGAPSSSSASRRWRRERDALARAARALEQRAPRDEHQRRALRTRCAAAAAAAAPGARAGGCGCARPRSPARATPCGCGSLEAREAPAAPLRSERAEQAAALEAERAAPRDWPRRRCARASRRWRRPPISTRPRRDFGRRLEASDRSAAECEAPRDRGRARSSARAASSRARGGAVGRTRRARAGARGRSPS